MEKIRDIQEHFVRHREERKKLTEDIRITTARLEKTEEKIKALKRTTLEEYGEHISKLKTERNSLLSSKDELLSRIKENVKAIEGFRGKIQEGFNPIKDVEQLDDSYPFLLFPLRLETRFRKLDGQDQLWIRVYPDDCNVVKKEPLMSDDELSNARIFWAEMTKAGKIESDERGAWNVLVNSHGANRAAWIIRQYKPLNDIPSRPDDSYKVLVIIPKSGSVSELKPEIQTYWKEVWLAQGNMRKVADARIKLEQSGLTTHIINEQITDVDPYNLSEVLEENFDPNKVIVSVLHLPETNEIVTTQTSWNEAPHAVSLPDRFVAITYSGDNKTTYLFENAVRDYLPVGLDPSLEEGEISKDREGIHLNEELKWMVDFDEAIKAGMATKLNITTEESVDGFDQLFVFGLRVSSDAQLSKKELEDLISAHKESEQGFEFIKQGTPTNNTEDNPSGYSWTENADESYDRIFKGAEDFSLTDDITGQSDGQRFADSLGIEADILQSLPNANGRDQLEASAMNTALFPATMGYFMEEMMDPLFDDEDILNTRRFFSEYVSGRGPIPTIKIGRQPYGILPVVNFPGFDLDDSNHNRKTDKLPYPARLYSLLKKMDESWDKYLPQVSHIGKDGDPHQILLDVLGLHANSVEFHQRYAQSLQQVYNQLNLQFGNPLIAQLFADAISGRAKEILHELELNPDLLNLPILGKFFLSKPNILSGPLVDDVPESEVDPIRSYSADGKNYIEWLRSVDGERIRQQDFGGNPTPNALLYLLLRHSLQLTQAKSATNLLLSHDLIDNKRVYFDPDFLHISPKELGRSKFEHLYGFHDTITGDKSVTLMEHLYNRDVLNTRPEVNELNQVLEALSLLEKTPTSRLERLLTEHLDCCSYRIDAWKTGLSYYQLKEQQMHATRREKDKDKGIYLGAYGLLLDLRPRGSNLNEVKLSAEDAEYFAPNGQKIYRDDTNLGHIHAPSVDQAATAAILRNAYASNEEAGDKNPFAINLSSERIRIANDFLEGIRNGQTLSALLGYQFERGLHDRYETSNIEADKFIYPLRMVFPLVSNKLKNTQVTTEDIDDANSSNNNTDTSIEAIEARNVIDGLRLIEHIQNTSTKSYPFDLPEKHGLPTANESEKTAITEEVNRLIDIHDAIADLVMSEQVFQAVKGNFDRASGVAEAFSKGSYPPEMEVINTPRTGLALTHKMAIHFNGEASPTLSPNSVTEMTPRAESEPSVNEWLSEILPSPDNLRVKVELEEPGKTGRHVFVSQQDLGLQSIDLLFSMSLDNDQAMSELDDRIVNYLLYRYKDPDTNTPLNPFTKIAILYTEEIDPDDRSKVSFFELGTMLQSLKKLLLNNPYLTHTSIQFPSENGGSLNADYDVLGFLNRITGLKDDLETIKSDLQNSLNGVKSIHRQCGRHREELLSVGVEESEIPEFNQILTDDLKYYLIDQSNDVKDELVNDYVDKLDALHLDAGKIAALAEAYNSYLMEYVEDFLNLSDLIKETSEKFTSIAFFDNTLTGTGFINQAVSRVYENTVEKIKVVVERWERKGQEYDEIMAAYNPSKPIGELIEIVQKAEMRIASSGSFPIPTDPDVYKSYVGTIKNNFDILLDELRSIAKNEFSDVNDFLSEVNATLKKIGRHDLIFFDTKNNRNDLYEAYHELVVLKEDIYTAIDNQIKYIDDKLNAFIGEIDGYEELPTAVGKIDKLLSACRKILNEDIVVLPKVTFSGKSGELLSLAFGKSDSIQDFSKEIEEREFPVDDWLSGVARVRANAWELENVISLAQGFNPAKSLELKPLQFPYRENDRWLALKYLKDPTDPGYNEDEENTYRKLKGDSLLYTGHFAKGFDKTKPTCGIIIDEWTEVIPSKEETTGIAFHYDQPGSEPPQTMLLVSPSQIKGNWQWDDLLGAMEEVLSMAKKRAVEPSMVSQSKFGQFLPTTLMAVTSHWISVAMNLSVNNLPTSNK